MNRLVGVVAGDNTTVRTRRVDGSTNGEKGKDRALLSQVLTPGGSATGRRYQFGRGRDMTNGQTKQNKTAPAGNRTRVCTVVG